MKTEKLKNIFISFFKFLTSILKLCKKGDSIPKNSKINK